MVKHLKLTDLPLTYLSKFREYGLQYTDGGSAFQVIHYCPWCGQPLPHSLRHQWFEAIERLGLEPDDDDLPEEYQSEEWYLQELAFS
jgi:hypothetical protein